MLSIPGHVRTVLILSRFYTIHLLWASKASYAWDLLGAQRGAKRKIYNLSMRIPSLETQCLPPPKFPMSNTSMIPPKSP